MIESPLIKEIVDETKQAAKQEAIVEVLQARFGTVPDDFRERLRSVRAEKKLNIFIKHAAQCADLAGFRKRLG